jgi:ankyrin repeat protein
MKNKLISCKPYEILIFLLSMAFFSPAKDLPMKRSCAQNDSSPKSSMVTHTQSQESSRPLFYAVGRGDLAKVKQLIAAGIDVNERDEAGWTPLFVAMTNKKETPQLIDFLVNAGAEINATDHQGYTPLLRAIGPFGSHANIRALLARGADVNRTNHFGDTAIMVAAGWDDTVTIKLLLQKKAEPNIKRNDGGTALMIASKLGHDEAVQVLLVGGANPHDKNGEGKTALTLAEEELRTNKSVNISVKRKLTRIISLLRQAQVNKAIT